MKYTYTFEKEDEWKFREVLSRLDPSEYIMHQDVVTVEKEKIDPRYWQREAILEMDPEACLTFRLGMKHIKIRRERTEEELAAEKALDDQNTVKITVKVDGMLPPTP